MQPQLSGGLEPTTYNGQSKDARPSARTAWRWWFAGCMLSGLITIIGCDTDDNSPQIGIYPGPEVSMNSYPLDIGNTWQYQVDVIITGDEPSVSAYTCRFEIISDSLINGIPTKAMEQIQMEELNTFYGTHWFAQTDSGLVGLAEQGSGSSILLKTELHKRPSFFSDGLSALEEGKLDTVILVENPIYLMRFPAVIGESWYSNEYSPTIAIVRKWAGYNTVVTEAGSFDCLKLELFSDADGDGEPDPDFFFVVQYVSPYHGLIMEIRFKEVQFGNGLTGQLQRIARLVEVNF